MEDKLQEERARELSQRFKAVKKFIGMSVQGRRKTFLWNQLYLADLADIEKAAVVNIELGGRYSIDELMAVIKSMGGRLKIEWPENKEKPKVLVRNEPYH